jgi:formate/nitrite transporter FocA (FNT family)
VCYELGVSAAKTLLYTATGAIGAPAREVAGSVTLAAGTLTLTLTGAAVYTSNASYICTANSSSGTNPVQVVRNSGSSVTFNGTGTDQVMFRCVGN